MADAGIRLSTEGSGPLVDNSIFTAASSSDDTFRQRIVIGGDASSSGFVNPSSAAPSSGDYSLPVRLNAGSTAFNFGSVLLYPSSSGITIGAVALLPGSSASLLGSVVASSASQMTVIGGTSGTGLGTIVSTGAGAAAIDPRQATVVGGTSGAGLGTIVSTGVGGAAIDPRQSTIVAGTSGAGLGTILSTGAGGAAIDPRIVTPSSQWTITPAASTTFNGIYAISTSTAGTIIDTRMLYSSTGAAIAASTVFADGMAYLVRLAASSSGQTIGNVTVSNSLTVTPSSQFTVTAALAAASTIGANIISSTGASVATSTVFADGMSLLARLAASSSGQTIGAVALVAGTTSNIIGSVAIVEGSSAVDVGVIMVSTALGGAAIDPRVLTSSTGASIGTSTVFADGMAILTRTAASSSGQMIGQVVLGAGSTATVIGQVAQSTAWSVTVRSALDSTGNYNQKMFYSTGFVPDATSTTRQLAQVTNFTSGSSGTSFNVASGKIFRIEYINCSITPASGANLWCDFTVVATASTGGATGTTPPIWRQRLSVASPTSAAVSGGTYLSVTDLTLDIPSTGSFGLVAVSNSSVNLIATFGMGGVEYTI